MTHIQIGRGHQMDGLETQDIPLGRRITILMRTESLGLSILIGTWQHIKRKHTLWLKKSGFAPNAVINESNTSSLMAKL